MLTYARKLKENITEYANADGKVFLDNLITELEEDIRKTEAKRSGRKDAKKNVRYNY